MMHLKARMLDTSFTGLLGNIGINDTERQKLILSGDSDPGLSVVLLLMRYASFCSSCIL